MNGQSVGKLPYGYSTFEFDISGKIKFGETKLVALKVMNEGGNSHWYTVSGIYRHVWMDVVDPDRIRKWGTFITTPEVKAEQAKVNIQTKLINNLVQEVSVKFTTTIKSTIVLEVGRQEVIHQLKNGEEADITAEIPVKNPELWLVNSPALYSAISEVYLNNNLIDRVEDVFGIRTISFDAVNGFQLNGKTMKLLTSTMRHPIRY